MGVRPALLGLALLCALLLPRAESAQAGAFASPAPAAGAPSPRGLPGPSGSTSGPGPGGASLPLLSSLRFEPPTFRAGERVRASLELEAGALAFEPLELRGAAALAGLPQDPALELEGLSLSRSGGRWLYVLTFTPWAPGPSSFPPLSLKGKRLPGFDYLVQTTTGPGERLPGPRRPQADPPGAALYLYAGLGFLILLVLLILALVFWLLPGALALREAWRARAALRRFLGTLEWLEEDRGEGEGGAWYALLSRALRLYLSARLLPEALALTPEEFRSLPGAGLPPGDFGERLAELLGLSDEVRFGALATGAAERRASAEGARSLVRLVEDFRSAAREEAADARP